MEKLSNGFDGKVSESGSVLLGKRLDKLECLVDTNGQPESNDTFRGRSPSTKHDFFSDGNVFRSGKELSNGNVCSNNQQEVEDEDLLGKQCVQRAGCVESELKEVHE